MICRRAFTLVELLITMAAGSALMLLAVGLVHQTMHLTSVARGRADEHRAISRLAAQFRHDVHRADDVFIESAQTVRIRSGEFGEVTYIVKPQGCVRVASGQPAERSGPERYAHESFALQPGGGVYWELMDQPRRAAMSIYRSERPGSEIVLRPLASDLPSQGRPPTLRVEAVIGRMTANGDRQAEEDSQ
jgi:prepilin-type N-terminal cleavage/methylation domain-containing protein